jgi:hypothetical protein
MPTRMPRAKERACPGTTDDGHRVSRASEVGNRVHVVRKRCDARVRPPAGSERCARYAAAETRASEGVEWSNG